MRQLQGEIPKVPPLVIEMDEKDAEFVQTILQERDNATEGDPGDRLLEIINEYLEAFS